MESLGATCKKVYPIKKSIELFELDDYFMYMDIKKFGEYLNLELSILECVPYGVTYKYIEDLTGRLERFITVNIPSTSEENDPDHQADLDNRKREYLHRIAWLLEKKSGFYQPSMGSVPESIGIKLFSLSAMVIHI
jgi:hypothetical protein